MLFIVGGAFAGLEKIIDKAARRASASARRCIPSATSTRTIGIDVMPEDLLKFGMIPEFIGRLPVITTVTNLDRDALIRILTEPKNALVKQYQKLMELDGVELEFSEDALDAIADQATCAARRAGAARHHGRSLAVSDVRSPTTQGRRLSSSTAKSSSTTSTPPSCRASRPSANAARSRPRSTPPAAADAIARTMATSAWTASGLEHPLLAGTVTYWRVEGTGSPHRRAQMTQRCLRVLHGAALLSHDDVCPQPPARPQM